MSNTNISPELQAKLNHFSQIQKTDESVFLGLQVAGGQILLPCLVLTVIFSRNVHRNPDFINFCCSWIFSSIIYSLLVYRGRSDPLDLSLSPSYQECLVQASLINGVQTLTACTTTGIAIQLLRVVLSIKRGVKGENTRSSHLISLILLISPYTIFLVFTVISVILGNQPAYDTSGFILPDSNLSVPGVFYCIILSNNNPFSLARASLYFSLIVTILSLCVEVSVVITILRNLRSFRALLPTGWARLLIRIIVFSVYRLGLLCLMFQSPFLANPEEIFLTGISSNPLYNGVIDLMQATVPLVVFFIFASERDILNAWCFWRRKKSAPEPVVKGEVEDSSVKPGDFEV